MPPLPHPSIQRKNFPVHLSIIPYKQYKIKPPHVLHTTNAQMNIQLTKGISMQEDFPKSNVYTWCF